MKPDTKRVTIMLSDDKYHALNKEAVVKGVSLPTYCRLMLSELAEGLVKPKDVAA